MAITTLTQVVDGMLPTVVVAKTAESSANSNSQMLTNWYSVGYPPTATANTSGVSGQALTSSPAALPFKNPVSGNSYLTGFLSTYYLTINNTSQRSTLMVDRLWENSGLSPTVTTAQTVNSVAWPARDLDESTNGRGVFIAVEVSSALGAGAGSGLSGWYSTNILGNRDGEVLDDPDNFKTKEESKLGVLEDILQPSLFPDLYGNVFHSVKINYYPPRGDNKEGWDNIDIFGWLGYPMQIKVNFLCRDSILAAPLALDLVLFMDLAQRAGLGGIQEWLSFYYKSPQVAPGLHPEHDLFVQLAKLKNTVRWMMNEDQITHLGREYYDEA